MFSIQLFITIIKILRVVDMNVVHASVKKAV